jgi:RNA polymerase sigma factor (sigma-70 family)
MDEPWPESTTDAALLAGAGQGDRSALAALYDRYATPAYSLAAGLVGVSRAADVVHDAFVALLEKAATFDPARGNFRGWFMTSIHHRCLNVLRKNTPLAGDGGLAAAVSNAPDPAEMTVRRLRDASVRRALDRLPEDQRAVLVLAYYHGLSQSALSARLGLPLGTVKARMRRALVALRGLLGDETTAAGKESGR